MSIETDDPNKRFPTRPLRKGTKGVIELPRCTLRVVSGPDTGRSVTVMGRSVAVGSGRTCDLTLSDDSVSRTHAVISPGIDGYILEDLGSTNGTEIDGVFVQKAVLKPGCRISVGETVLEFTSATHKLRPLVVDESCPEGLVGESSVMREVYATVRMVAPTEITVVILGETGTGKEVMARTLHRYSTRHQGPFVIFDCANVERELLGSGLFGHVRGAFTGAVADHTGAFDSARGGTLLLDEIGELPMELQARLLGALQRREIQPLGASRPHAIDVRVLAATHRKLENMVQAGQFREDLYYRLMVMPLSLPPLRERREDIQALVSHILGELAGNSAKQPGVSAAAMEILSQAEWKGNVRELRNRLERAFVLSQGGVILPAHVAAREATSAPVGAPRSGPTLGVRDAKRDAEKEIIRAALERCGWNRTRAARELGIGLSSIKRKIQEYGLAPEEK